MTDPTNSLAQRLIRNFNDVPMQLHLRQPLYESLGARLAQGTAAVKLGASVDTVAPGKVSCPYHFHHAQEEMFIVIEGSGTLRVAGEMLPLRSGDVVFIPPGPDYAHQIINTSSQPMKYLSISTQDSPEVVEYPDSKKFMAKVATGDASAFRAIQHSSNSVDYWEGEP